MGVSRILDGKKCSIALQTQLKRMVQELEAEIQPRLDVLLIGDFPASHSYVKGKRIAAESIGIKSVVHELPAAISLEEGLAKLEEIQANPDVNAVLVQLPLPEAWGAKANWEVIRRIRHEKDVDGFSPYNQGLLLSGQAGLAPCTPMGILALMKAYKIETRGKNICVIGRSSIVGNPIALLLSQKSRPSYNLGLGDATVTQCHSYTTDLAKICRASDITISAVGCANLLGAEMVRPEAVVIDVGISRVEDPSRKRGYRLVGDVDFATVAARCSAITPVPGGIGPMTITFLLYNTIQAACWQNGQPASSIDWEELQKAME